MIRISTRIWAVVLAVFVMPVGAIASGSAANKNNEKESATTRRLRQVLLQPPR